MSLVLNEILNDMGIENSFRFSEKEYDKAVIGISHDDRIIYDCEKLAEIIMERDKCEYEDAIEFIDFNMIRSIPYFGDKAPIIQYSIHFEDYE